MVGLEPATALRESGHASWMCVCTCLLREDVYVCMYLARYVAGIHQQRSHKASKTGNLKAGCRCKIEACTESMYPNPCRMSPAPVLYPAPMYSVGHRQGRGRAAGRDGFQGYAPQSTAF